MAQVLNIARHDVTATIDYDRMIRMLDADMLDSVGQGVPHDENASEGSDDVPDRRSAKSRLLPIARLTLAVSAVSILILARFSGM